MKIDVVTVHLEDFHGLELTLNSVRRFIEDSEMDWHVIDGASNFDDSSARDLFSLVRQTATHFVSEPDKGIYDAMNKGTSLAKGDYVLYLNAGDELHPDFELEKLESELEGDRPGMIWGTCHERFPDGTLVRVKTRSPKLSWYGIPVNHQNVLFRCDVLGAEPYDLRYRYLADYDLIGRLMQDGEIVHRSELPISIFHRGGTSSRNFSQAMKEEEELRQRYFGVSPVLSKAISFVKKINRSLGSIPALRRAMRRWV
jgi:putative colanic acid biosynthesis glycosyltransferase